MSKPFDLRALTRGAILAALYAALTLVAGLLGLGFGGIQLRFSEALTILPVFSAGTILPLTVGCALANLLGVFLGNPLAWLDVVCGTAATLIAACLTYLLRNIRVRGLPALATLPPILVNAFVVGLELTFILNGGFVAEVFWFNAMTVAIGQFAACSILGLLLYAAMKKYRLDRFFA